MWFHIVAYGPEETPVILHNSPPWSCRLRSSSTSHDGSYAKDHLACDERLKMPQGLCLLAARHCNRWMLRRQPKSTCFKTNSHRWAGQVSTDSANVSIRATKYRAHKTHTFNPGTTLCKNCMSPILTIQILTPQAKRCIPIDQGGPGSGHVLYFIERKRHQRKRV